MRCIYLRDGVCQGMYKGFGCIEEKCAYFQALKEAVCEHLASSGYCTKYHRFHCLDPEECEGYTYPVIDLKVKTAAD
ncbi:MAG: hypothetical protein AB1665_05470 [Candidatus Thermoplasmatota archaeon]